MNSLTSFSIAVASYSQMYRLKGSKNLWFIITPNFLEQVVGLNSLIKIENEFLAEIIMLSPSFLRSKSALTPFFKKHMPKVNYLSVLRYINASVKNWVCGLSIRWLASTDQKLELSTAVVDWLGCLIPRYVVSVYSLVFSTALNPCLNFYLKFSN